MRLVDVLPLPSLRAQRLIAAAVVLTQGGIAVTGAIVRVTASGLGCPTWPQCFPGSFTPIPHAEVPGIHQAVEFGNRLITFLVVLTAALAVLAVTRARRRREVLLYAWLMPASTVVQAVIGGITVLTGLLWWTVAIHLLVVDDDGVAGRAAVRQDRRARRRRADITRAEAAAAVDDSDRRHPGRRVGHRHPGDRRRVRTRATRAPTGRCRGWRSRSPRWCTCTPRCWWPIWRCLVALGFGTAGGWRTPGAVLVRLGVLIGLVLAQGLVGTVQFFTGVPAALVAVHVAGAAACTAATSALWASMRERTEPEPLQR